MSLLENKLQQILPAYVDDVVRLRREHGGTNIGSVSFAQAAGGMRGVNALVCDTSSVDPECGLLIRGRPLRELLDRLPEEIFWLLLTGEFPDEDELVDLQLQIGARHEVPAHVWRVLETMPANSHPMAMLSAGLISMHYDSAFAYRIWNKRYSRFWALMLEDALRILGRLPVLAAGIYRIRYKKGPRLQPSARLDLAGNLAHLLGLEDSEEVRRFMRRYLVVHSDHESGNATAYSTLTVASALNDAYYSLAAGMAALAGPLHGQAAKEALRFQRELLEKYVGMPTKRQLEDEVAQRLASGRLVHGFGHAVLRVEDPRYRALCHFGEEHFPDDELLRVACLLHDVVPDVLRRRTKVASPHANVDAISGAVLSHYGIVEPEFFTVLFGVGLSIGLLAQLVLARALDTPLMRPKSITSASVREV
jgi:citrate synthase